MWSIFLAHCPFQRLYLGACFWALKNWCVLASAWCTLTVLEICNLQRMPCSSRASTNWGAFCCCLLNDISQAQAQLHASARLQPPSLLLSQVFLRMTPLPGVILSARPQNCYKLMAELMAGSFLSPCAVPCQRIGPRRHQ